MDILFNARPYLIAKNESLDSVLHRHEPTKCDFEAFYTRSAAKKFGNGYPMFATLTLRQDHRQYQRTPEVTGGLWTELMAYEGELGLGGRDQISLNFEISRGR